MASPEINGVEIRLHSGQLAAYSLRSFYLWMNEHER